MEQHLGHNEKRKDKKDYLVDVKNEGVILTEYVIQYQYCKACETISEKRQTRSV